jgi:hypothetical protein
METAQDETAEEVRGVEVVEARHLGRLLRAARIAAGYATAAEAAAALSEASGQHVTERVLGSLERGETKLSFEMLVLVTCVMAPMNGPWMFMRAISEEFQTVFLDAARRGLPAE